MKSTFIVAGLIGFASAGGFALAAPASAACAQGFTSIPCTIAQNVSTAPAQTAGSLAAAPGQFVGGVVDLPNQAAQGLQTPAQLAGVGCPVEEGETVPCGLPAVPGQFFGPGGGLEQIVTAPQTIAGALAAAPGQFVSAINNGGTAPSAPSGGDDGGSDGGGDSGGGED